MKLFPRRTRLTTPVPTITQLEEKLAMPEPQVAPEPVAPPVVAEPIIIREPAYVCAACGVPGATKRLKNISYFGYIKGGLSHVYLCDTHFDECRENEQKHHTAQKKTMISVPAVVVDKSA